MDLERVIELSKKVIESNEAYSGEKETNPIIDELKLLSLCDSMFEVRDYVTDGVIKHIFTHKAHELPLEHDNREDLFELSGKLNKWW